MAGTLRVLPTHATEICLQCPSLPTARVNKCTFTESQGLEKNISCKWRPKKAGVAILISDKIDFKIKAVKGDKEGHYIMIKGSIQEEDITIINIYAPNIGALQYVRQMLMSMK